MSELKLASPKVYLVGRQSIDDAELDRFLADEGVEQWSKDTDVAGQKLAETAGRLCYMSFAKPRPGGNQGYLGHIKEVGHGCYDAETDVLTDGGWVPFPAVQNLPETARFATLSDSGEIEYQRATAKIAVPYSGNMICFVPARSGGVDLLVTPNHMLYAGRTTTSLGRKKASFSLQQADSLLGVSHKHLKAGRWGKPADAEYAGLSLSFMTLLGFAIGDGSLMKGGVEFHLRRPRKIDFLRQVVAGCGFQLAVSADHYRVAVPLRSVERQLLSQIYTEDKQKQIPQKLLLGCSQEQATALLEGLLAADGHRHRTGVSFDTTSQVLAGQMQWLALHAGVAANIGYTVSSERRATGGSHGSRPLTRLHILSGGSLRPEVNKWSGAGCQTSVVPDWSGTVYCVEVPNHTLYVRRGGKPVWCGNSVLEHAVFNLIITGVSRSFTHELVRHRSGWSYSQLSQRYVDEADCSFVMPPLIQRAIATDHGSDVSWCWHRAVAKAQDAYAELSDELYNFLCIEAWRTAGAPEGPDTDWNEWGDVDYALDWIKTQPAEIRTSIRKQAREAARSVLPNATETKIFVTGNVRALRHFIEMRGNKAADAEIQQVAGMVLDVLAKEAPNLFGDYTRGPEGIETPFRKV